ncbi:MULTISPECIES: helix-turn-helix transcriptional regulator [Chryseobacterium]|nr:MULTISPECIES: tetratricopeptide repeat protein [Chryseobacterium]
MKLLEKAGKPFGYDYNYLNVASTYETLGELDKAEFFYRKSLKVSTGNLKGMGYCNLAHLAFLHGRFEDATNYANTSLDYQENNSNKRYRDIAEIYQLLTKIYTETGNTAAAKKSEKLFEYYHNKENYTNELFKKKLLIQLLAKAELNQKDFEMEVSKKSRNLLVFSVISMVLIICLGMIYMKQVKSNRKTIEKNNEQLSELSQQINNSFSEVLELAKSDDPAFIPRFKEVYPVFYQNLLSRYPDLTIAQIRFCCLLRLNFSTKEVAHYHRLTIKGVQTRKTRLRKQLNIPSDADLNLWMMNLG